jgi:hypothetical protein
MPSAAAISSLLSPPKYFNSTTCTKRIQSGELLQRVINANDLFFGGCCGVRDIGPDCDMRGIATVTLRDPLAREIDEDRSHNAGCIAKKMCAVAQVELANLHEPQVALVHKRTSVEQCDLGRPSQTLVRELTQLLVGEGNNLVDGTRLAVARGDQ